MTRNIMLLICAAAMIFSAAMAAADGYMGISVGSASVDDPQGDFDYSDLGFKLFGAYRFNENWAIEGFYADFGKSEESILGFSASINVDGSGAQIVGAFPVSDQVKLFGKLGFISWDADLTVTTIVGTAGVRRTVSDNDEDLTYGIGVTFNVSEEVSIRGEWEFYDDIDVDLLSVGFEVSF